MELLEDLRRSRRSRRTFLAAMTAAGLGLAADRLLSARPARAADPAADAQTTAAAAEPGVPTDGAAQFAGIPGADINTKVLNFALTLEILEADLYRQALNLASGLALATPLNANANAYKRAVIGGGGLDNDARDEGYQYLKQFTYVEAAHRDFLRAALGSAAVKPNPGGYRFPNPPAANIYGILANILPLEETGVRAYLGALPYLTNLTLAQTAGTIYSTECRHSAVIAYQIGLDPGPAKTGLDKTVVPGQRNNTFEYYLDPKQVVAAARLYFV